MGRLRSLFIGALMLQASAARAQPTHPEAHPTASFAARATPRFQRLTSVDGLSNNSVYAILQDSKGFMWFGTANGLNRYDGRSMKRVGEEGSPAALSSQWVRALFETRDRMLFIGTWGGGVNVYDPTTEALTVIRHDSSDPGSLPSDNVAGFLEDAEGNLWVSTLDRGVTLYRRDLQRFVRIGDDPKFPAILRGTTTGGLLRDRSGGLWFGSADGLARYRPAHDDFTTFGWSDPPAETHASGGALLGKNVVGIAEDRQGGLWLAVQDGGLNRYDTRTGRFTSRLTDSNWPRTAEAEAVFVDSRGTVWLGTLTQGLVEFDPARGTSVVHRHSAADPTSLGNDVVKDIQEDRSGNLWIGTEGGGVSRLDLRAKPFVGFAHDPDAPNSLSSNDVRAFHEDKHGNLWIGTRIGGLNRLTPTTGDFVRYQHIPGDPQSLPDSTVWTIHEDRRGQLWLGTDGAGLVRFDPESSTFELFAPNGDDPSRLYNGYVYAIEEDETGALWIGSWGGGLARLDPGSGLFENFRHDPNDPTTLSDNAVLSLLLERKGALWVGTWQGGLQKFDRTTKRFRRFRHDRQDPGSLSFDGVVALHEDRAGALWVGTRGGGLNRKAPGSETFEHFGVAEGLPSENVVGLTEDARGHLWILTDDGLSRFDPQAKHFRNYDVNDGLPSNELNRNACAVTRAGVVLVGSVNGFVGFHPEAVRDNDFVPPIVLTDFRILNRSAPVGENEVLRQAIPFANSIELPPEAYSFSLSFAALCFNNASKNQLAYQLEGFDQGWVRAEHNTVTYTTLPPGTYTFRVKGSNHDGVWNESGTAVRLVVLPPWWKTWWFLSLATLAGLGLVAGAFMLRVRAMAAQNRALVRQVDRGARELAEASVKLRELDAAVRLARLGQYELLERIGGGGMGEVYRARHALMRRPTVVKLLPVERAGAAAVARFEREVQLTARLTHPNTITVFDYGHTPEGVFYYAMEYLEGADLDRLLQVSGPMPPARVLHVMRGVASALSEAHSIGLIHRDIKPANVFLCRRGNDPDFVKVLDFGLVKDMAEPLNVPGAGSDVTLPGVVMGTPAFMAPEALRSSTLADARSDLYALGAIAYTCLTGAHVFESESLYSLVVAHVTEAPVPPSVRLGAPVPPSLERLVLDCLAHDPAHRPASAEELLARLADCTDVPAWTDDDARHWWKLHGVYVEQTSATRDGATPVTLVETLPGTGPLSADEPKSS
jgi:ligand-binding sensor domain-containing protein/serine/threonine protein kinase